MTLPRYDEQASFFDVSFLAEGLFEESDKYRIFRTVILPALEAKRGELCRLYCSDNGRAAVEPVILAGVMLLQFMEKAPDRQAVHNVRLNLGWKHALNLQVDYKGFHPTTLVYFRNRLLENDQARCVFDAVLHELNNKKLIERKGKQRIDSTHILGCVAQMSRLEIVRETIRLFLEMVEHIGMDNRLPCWGQYHERYMETEPQWHKMEQKTLFDKFHQSGIDMHDLLTWAQSHPAIGCHDRTDLLKRVFEEQYEIIDNGLVRRKVELVGCVKNPHDPQVQWSCKQRDRTKGWEGYKTQIAETVPQTPADQKIKDSPTKMFITEVTTTEAIASDLAGRRRLEEAQEKHGLGAADELYADGGYISDDTLAKAAKEGRRLIGPARPSANPSGTLFTVEDFDISISERKAICPAGHNSTQCSTLENQKTGKIDYRFEWSYQCDDCSSRSKCTKSFSGRRMLVVGQHHDYLQARRREMHTEEFKRKMQRRNAIEGTISEFIRNGARRTRYRGLAKTALANYLHGAAINAKRWIRQIQYEIQATAAMAV